MSERPAEPRPDAGPVWCVVVAAGSGSRYGGAKQYELIGGRRVLDRAVATAAAVCDGVVVVLSADRVGDPAAAPEVPVDAVVAGGATRAASVRAGLAALPSEVAVVLVHDAARPLATAALFRRVVAAVRAGADAVVPVVAVTDTVRSVDGGVVDRESLRAVQTPQGFRADVLRAAHLAEPDATDDATLVEITGVAVELVDGEATNIKITGPHDRAVAEAVLAERADAGGDSAS